MIYWLGLFHRSISSLLVSDNKVETLEQVKQAKGGGDTGAANG